MEENSIEKDINRCNKLADPINATWIGISNQLAIINILSDYKRVLKMNEVLLKENEEIRIKNNAIKRESEAYAEHMIRLDNELNLEKEKSKYEWIRQNCLSQELVNKLYIPIQKIKDKIENLKKVKERNIKRDFDTVYKDGYFTGGIDTLQELLESEE